MNITKLKKETTYLCEQDGKSYRIIDNNLWVLNNNTRLWHPMSMDGMTRLDILNMEFKEV